MRGGCHRGRGGSGDSGCAESDGFTIPIVMVRIGDPVGAGFVASLARPGRNITGLSNMNAEIISKYLELLRVAVPKLSRVTVLANPDNSSHADFLKRIQATARRAAAENLAPAQSNRAPRSGRP